jgi:hypothetical protein
MAEDVRGVDGADDQRRDLRQQVGEQPVDVGAPLAPGHAVGGCRAQPIPKLLQRRVVVFVVDLECGHAISSLTSEASVA